MTGRANRGNVVADTWNTYEAAARAKRPSGVLVAADCEEIAAVVRDFGGRVELTSPDCASGTDRVAEIARQHPHIDVFVNVQGDEPEISAAAIDLAVELLERDAAAVMSTLATPIRDRQKLADPACVKVVFDEQYRALYFSRAPIPFARDAFAVSRDALPDELPVYRHLGLYAYRARFLREYTQLAPAAIERFEALEQLRALWHGHRIALIVTAAAPEPGVDTPADLERTRKLFGAV